MAAGVAIGQAAGAGLGIVAQLRQGAAEQKTQQYNANLADRQAYLTEVQAAEEERRQRIYAKKQLADIRSNYAASGVSSSEGSALDVLENSAYEAEMDAQTIRYVGKQQAAIYRGQANQFRFKGREARIGATLGAIGSGLSLGGKIAGGSG